MSSKCSPVVGSSKMKSVPSHAGLRQMRRQLHALRFAARKRRRRLPQPQIAQPDIVQHLQLCTSRGVSWKKAIASRTVSCSTSWMFRPCS